MINMNIQIGVNPLVNHSPSKLFKSPQSKFNFTLGVNGETVAWNNLKPIYQMCPSINADADKILAITIACLRDIDETRESLKIVTIHSDNKVRIWSQSDGTCLNISSYPLFNQKIIAIISPPFQTRFLIVLAQQSFYILDCWVLKCCAKIFPKKQTYSRFTSGIINQQCQLQLYDNSNRAHLMDVSKIFSDKLLDFGKYLNNFQKAYNELILICQEMKSLKVQSVYKRIEFAKEDLAPYETVLSQIKNQILPEMIISPEILKQYPDLLEILRDEIANISSLNFIQGKQLFYFLGSKAGNFYGFPCSTKKNEPLMILKSENFIQSPIRYIRVLNNHIFVSWQNGMFRIYSTENLISFLEIAKINKIIEVSKTQKITGHEVWIYNTSKITVLEKQLSSFIKYTLPAYHYLDGKINKGLNYFRLDRNQIISFNDETTEILHYRGISEEIKIYCVFIIEDYVAVCTQKGIELYSPKEWERFLDYSEWVWEDFSFLTPNKTLSENSINHDFSCKTGNSLMKFNCRYIFDKIDYYSNPQSLYSQTFGKDQGAITNEQFAHFYFLQKGQVQKAIHSKSGSNFMTVVKMKLNSVRKDSWTNAVYIINGVLNSELQNVINSKQNEKEILDKNYEFYSLFSWNQFKVPYLSHTYKDINKHFIFLKRFTAQGIGKTFTFHFQPVGRIKMSDNMLTTQSVASIALFQSILKDIKLTDQMVESVSFFSSLSSTLFQDSGNILLAKLSVSRNQSISKACINLLISKIVSGKINMHPIFQYFILNLKVLEASKNKILSYNETVWIVYLGLGNICSHQQIDKDLVKILIQRVIDCLDISNFQIKPYYLLVVMKIFHEGIEKWKDSIDSNTIVKLLIELFKIYFYYEGIDTVASDDKKFNFCFANVEGSLKKLMKQHIIKTVIYIYKQFVHEFHQVLKNESINQKLHPSYPASVIQILRQFIKTQRPQHHLVFYIQLLLQCLSPMTPNLRKYVQKSILNTLQLICNYGNVSFNLPSQKLSVKTHNHLYIYCIRTCTKWRTINIKDDHQHETAMIQMSPKGTYVALLSDKLRIWRLSSGFWSGVLGAFSQDWVFDVKGKSLKWEENESSITVINQNPSKNQVIKL